MKKINPPTVTLQVKGTDSDNLESEQSIASSFYEKLPDQVNFLEATRQGYYTYWLTLADVNNIARIEYNNFKQFKGKSSTLNSDFKILNSLENLLNDVKDFQKKAIQTEARRMTLISNMRPVLI